MAQSGRRSRRSTTAFRESKQENRRGGRSAQSRPPNTGKRPKLLQSGFRSRSGFGPTAQEAYRETGRVPALLRLRVFLLCVVCAVSVVFMFFSQGGWNLAGLQLKAEAAAAVQLALMLLATVLAPEVLVKGITQCLQLRFNLESLVSCSVIVMGIHGCTSISSGQMPFCVVGSLGLLFGLWSDQLQRQAQRLSLKAVQNLTDLRVFLYRARLGNMTGASCALSQMPMGLCRRFWEAM